MISPALEVQYDAHPGPASQPLVELTVTTDPRRSSKCGIAARAIKKAPVRLICSVRSHACSVSSPAGSESPRRADRPGPEQPERGHAPRSGKSQAVARLAQAQLAVRSRRV